MIKTTRHKRKISYRFYKQASIVFSTVLASLLLCSCGSTNQARKNNISVTKKLRLNSRDNALDFVRQQEAKLVDIPVAMSLEPMIDYCVPSVGDGVLVMGYESMLAMQDLVAFYDREMERCGWCMVSRFQSCESLLNFEKPNRVCSISIRINPMTQKTEMVIFAGYKDHES